MGNKPEKDRAEKYLEAYSDVFADIVNVLVLQKPVIRPEDLTDGPTASIYKAESDTGLREQSRDTAKYMEKSGVTIALFGIENQSAIDKEMVYRMMGYDYASYKRQAEEKKGHYPVISVVLYFGKRQWTGPLFIRDTMNVPEEFEIAFNDYRTNVVDVPRLPQEVRQLLTSDFRAVADFFAEEYADTYHPGSQVLKHPQAVLQLLRVFTGDKRYEDIQDEIIASCQKGEEITMCAFAERMEQQGISKGKIQGQLEGKLASIFELLGYVGTVPEDVQKRIAAERDEEVLKRWLKLAARADSIKQFMDNM